MLFMVIERIRKGGIAAVAERFQKSGRMLPNDVLYVNSWMEANSSRCFQVMEAPGRESLEPWINQWSDLVDFEVVPVLPSTEFWKKVTSGLLGQS